MGMIGYAKAGKEMARVFRCLRNSRNARHFTISAESADDSSSQRVSVPGTTSTRWSSTKAVPSLRRWAECITFISIRRRDRAQEGEPYPDKTVLLVDLHEFTISNGST